jgi:hypothetical protein
MLVGLGFRPRAMAGWGWCWSTDRIVVDIMPSMPWRGWGGGWGAPWVGGQVGACWPRWGPVMCSDQVRGRVGAQG